MPLTINLNSNANNQSVQALIANLTFRTQGDTPTAGNRTVTIAVSDGASATSGAVTRQVAVSAVNDSPVIGNLGAAVSYTENAAQLIIAPSATLTDVDSADFAGGVLTVTITANAQTTDILAIRSQGTAVGQIGVTGSNVTYSGIQIGTLAGGTSPVPLTVTLNANASPAAVEALVRNVSYRATAKYHPTWLALCNW